MPERWGNPKVRVWDFVLEAYAAVAEKYHIATTDLVSIVLIHGPDSTSAIVRALCENFGMSGMEALHLLAELDWAIMVRARRKYEVMFGGRAKTSKIQA